ncbi:asparagine--tRNA ligase [Thermaurantimonas aggregans]|uniref:Asparagine--tRNA ligase n=1 Tax=Thermaurantimonas aggregans TaxID=2173829 RepID=A0A401XIU5_9FLAO|nr:asparagine--tRNA ligase [Thermaurantimonas aggregans]MCX8147860.1 asparagine--tRNA ligase [Thermaurantimonas aggregans]GCD76911.1 asparagine--tRNA ligase [Thermaurantimonas aggregans]
MKNEISIADLYKIQPIGREITISGWVRTFRSNRFIALNDGSTAANFQCVVDFEKFEDSLLKRITTGSCVRVKGIVTKSLGKGQPIELQVQTIEILGDSDAEKYPLQPKKHSLEFLREIAHLRPRTTTFGAIFRIRHHLAFAIHEYFNKNGFFYIHSPIITASDAEGAGEMFNVSVLDKRNIPLTENGEVDYSKDFFGKEANLTVSGQLEAELLAMGLGKVYTFGPTFRAENSNTARHLAEFWMIEPEMAFYELKDNMDLAEDFLKYIIKYALTHAADDLAILDQRLAEEEKSKPADQRSMPLLEKLKFVTENAFQRITYTEAIDILLQSPYHKKKKFQFPVEWGIDLQSEHERYLVEKHFNSPVIITDYPAAIKAFYMRLNDDGKTVRAMDILVPGIGEIVGGSQREERYDVLLSKIRQFGISEESLWWYLDTRRFGTCPHSGFGLGFERLVQFVTGMSNIRDVIPFPRTPGNCEF